MRKEIPMLDDTLTKEEVLNIIVESFQTVIFATVDNNDIPHSNAADIELNDQNKLIFSTYKGGAFYRRLKYQPTISFTGLKGTETLNSVAITVNGKVEELDVDYLAEIYVVHPEMGSVSNKDTLRPFAITPTEISVYDLRRQPVFQKKFKF